MADPTVPTWFELLSLMTDGPSGGEPSLRGTIRSMDGLDEGRNQVAYARSADDPDPVFAGVGIEPNDGARVVRVWRDGDRARIEESDGQPSLICDGVTVWDFDDDHPAPVESPFQALRYGFAGTTLLVRRDRDSWLGTDFTHPTGPVGSTTFLRRPAWTVELAPPSHKPFPLQWVVDAETGIVLQQRNDGFGSVDEWTDFAVGEEFDPDLFVWRGDVRTAASIRWEQERAHEQDMAERARWFTDNVAPLPITLEFEVPLVVNEWQDDGSFFATFVSGGSLQRRLHSSEAWEKPSGTDEHRHEWTAGPWDYLVTFWRHGPTAAGLEALERQLGGTDPH